MARAMPGPAPPPKAKAEVAPTEDRAATKKKAKATRRGRLDEQRPRNAGDEIERRAEPRRLEASTRHRSEQQPCATGTARGTRRGIDRPTPRAPGSEAPRKASNTRPGMRRWKKKSPEACSAQPRGYEKKLRQRPTLPQRHRCSTIGSEELNFRVRDGIGWNLFDITTGKLWIASQPEFRDRAHPPRETRRGW